MTTNDRKFEPLFHAIALLGVTALVAWLIRRYDVASLARIDSMPPDAYIEYARHLHGHPYFFHFVLFLIIGGFYLGLIELIVYVLRLCVPARPAPETVPSGL
jgi:hypothetical protein